MASTFSNSGIELIATGDQSGTWGSTTNTNLQIIDRLTNGVGAITLSGTTHTLSTTVTGSATLSDGQYSVLVFGGSPSGTNTVTIDPNTVQHVYIVKNNSGQSVVLTQGSGGNVTVANDKSAIVYAEGAGSGSAVVDLTSTFNFGTVLSVDSGTGLTGGPITTTGSLSIALNGVTNTLLRDSAALSVIGRSTNTSGDPADIAAGTDNQVLRRSGSALAFGAVNLASSDAITGTLPVTNGGTGITAFGSNVATWLGAPSSANLAAAVTDETGSGALVFGISPALTTPTITGTVEKNSALGTGSGTKTFNLSNGNYFSLTVNGTTTLAVSNTPSSGSVGAFIVQLTNGGAYSITYFSGVTWAGGTAPTLTTSGTDVLGFFTTDGGTTWRGLVLALDIKAP
jgi:hypothetical protein